ncbi:Canalicular multispecific organic anion transporter 2 [Beauveria bassiana]|uniref:Canalicular multispecific organic anion transporter 2 n=1 Tax=Beauveria bassiana TaxID=176275 RepID=A0A2N6P2U2_BEABA|nr:Canalicular multispecific organic anion transporter 2 [Beauveria bassiana]
MVQSRGIFYPKIVALVLLVTTQPGDAAPTLVAAVVCPMLAALCMTALSYLEHQRSPRPSLLLAGYLLLTTLLDIARCRTFWLALTDSSDKAVAAVFTAATATKAVYMALESMHKRKWIQWRDEQPHSPEETSGLIGLGAYTWVNSLFLQGYRKVLHLQDLFPLDTAMRSSKLYHTFSQYLEYDLLRRDKNGLVRALARTLAVSLLLAVPPRLSVVGFTFCQPFFINRLLDFLSQGPSEDSRNTGYGLIGASILIYGGITLSMSTYLYLRTRSLQMVRGCLVSAICVKSTEIQQSGDEPETLTLMSADLERIRFGLRSMHNLWASPIEIGLASWLLYRQLGLAFLAPVLVVACCTGAIALTVKQIESAQKNWMDSVQKRTGLTSSLVARMKALRMSNLTTPIINSIQNLRVEELAAGSRFRGLLVLTAVIGFVPLLMSPVFTFAVTQRSLNSTKIFTSLSYMVLLANPLSALFQDIPQFFSALACISRIQKFLESDARQDFRSSNGVSEIKENIDALASQGITVHNGSFGWEAGNMVLKNINMQIRPGKITLVCGPTASGKSTLCSALLGEVPFHTGDIIMDNKRAPIAYCSQDPVLFNGTIKYNVLGGHCPNEERYSDVLRATLLQSDLQSESLPLGDQTNIGSNAIALSGGQKQRLALARALFANTKFMLLDDVFSGLDNKTAKQLFENVFGSGGLLRQRQCTVVLCSNNPSHFSYVDSILALGPDGSVIEQGSLDELMQLENGYIKTRCKDIPDCDVTEQDVITNTTNDEVKAPLQDDAIYSEPKGSDLDSQRRKGSQGTYKHYFKSVGYMLSLSIFVWGAAIGFSQNFPTVWLTYWGNDLSLSAPQHSSSYYIGIYALLNVGCIICLAALGITVFYAAVSTAGAKLHGDALSILQRAHMSFFSETDQGKIVNLFSQDMNLIDTELPAALLNGVLAVSMAIGQAAVLSTTSAYLAISYPFLIGFLWIIQHFYLRTSRQLRLLDLEAKSPMYAHFTDISKGIVTIRAFGLVDQHIETGFRLLDDSQRPAYLLGIIQNWLIMVLDLVTMVIAALLSSLAVTLRSNTGFTGASLVTLMSFGDQLTQIVVFLTLLETSLGESCSTGAKSPPLTQTIGAITRLQEFGNNVTLEEKASEVVKPGENWPQHASLELSNLLDPMPTGGGSVHVDGLSFDQIDRSTLRARFIAVPQDAVFLADGTTFHENLDPYAEADAHDCQAALEAVTLWQYVHDRGGLAAAMNPSSLSAGQKQLLALARAIVRHRLRGKQQLGATNRENVTDEPGGILLLDEVSANIDQETELVMQQVIRNQFAKYTVIAIAHRLNMIIDYDRVVVMDQGRIVEMGSPRLLSQQEGSQFHALWHAGTG